MALIIALVDRVDFLVYTCADCMFVVHRRNTSGEDSWLTSVWTRPCVTATPQAWTFCGQELQWSHS